MKEDFVERNTFLRQPAFIVMGDSSHLPRYWRKWSLCDPCMNVEDPEGEEMS